MLVSAIEHQYRVPYGVLWHNNGKVTDLEEKPTVTFQTNAGIYVVSNKALSLIPKNEFFDMTDLTTAAIKSNFKVEIFPIIETWLDVGIPQNLEDARSSLKESM